MAQQPITVSPKATEEIEEVAQFLGTSAAKMMGAQVDSWHQSPSFTNLLRRARNNSKAMQLLKECRYLAMAPVVETDKINEKIREVENLIGLTK